MFAARTCPRVRLASLPPQVHRQWQQRRWRAQISQDVLQTPTLLAEQLASTGLWNYGRWAKKGTKRPKGDRNRVNIVSDALCDDILQYIKPSLERHRGCDLIDIYPGAGLWSSKLHDVLQPRSHLLLEPDEAIYRPFLERSQLLAKPNVSLIPKSGIVWRDLSSVLNSTHLPHQVERLPPDRSTESASGPKRNDTLLVTANLAFFPRRSFAMFESLTQLVLYQFISSIRASSLFHKYGLVRMLVWVEHNDRHALLARSCQRRRRLAIEGELATDWIAEVAGPDDSSQWFVRDQQLDRASSRQVLAKMAAAGVQIPERRESQVTKEILGKKQPKRGRRGKEGPAVFARPWRDELKQLEAAFAWGKFAEKSTDHRRLLSLQYRANREAKVADAIHTLLQERDSLAAASARRASGGKAKTKTALRKEAEWNAAVDALPANNRKELLLQRDNMHIFHQDPPVLAWDRREQEPLIVRDEEFFPNAPCALLDIQPKTMDPLLRAMGPGSSRSGDVFELILRGMMAMGGEPVSKSIETVWPGATTGVLPYCPSLRSNVRKGGMPVGGPYGELSARTLNETQWVEILDAWMRWPFRPTLPQLVARIGDEGEVDTTTDDELGGPE